MSESSLPSILEPHNEQPPTMKPPPSVLPERAGKMLRFDYAETEADLVSNFSGMATPAAGSNERLDTTLEQNRTGSLLRSSTFGRRGGNKARGIVQRLRKGFLKFGRFIGPGFLVSVAYIDPGTFHSVVRSLQSVQC